MRFQAALFISLFALVIGCSDGVGHPIVLDTAATSAAAGMSTMLGGAGLGGAAAGMGSAGSSAGMGAAGLAGSAGMAAGSAGDGSFTQPPGDDFPGNDFGSGGRSGWDMNDPMGNPMGNPNADPVPDTAYCEPVADWDDTSRQIEEELFRFVNGLRTSRYTCGSQPPSDVPPLMMQPELRCAARLHSLDMSENDYLDHVNMAGVGPEDRMRQAGYVDFAVAGESIAQESPAQAMQDYNALAELFSAGGSDCQNLVEGRFDVVGIGVYADRWTLDFAGH